MSNSNTPDHYYNRVTELVDQSLAAVLRRASVTNGNVDLEKAIASSKALLEGFRDRTNEDIRELRELAEWEVFTIAVYGETNAGKSTLIETLRILLGDSEKTAMQQQFKLLASDLRFDAPSLAALDDSIQQLELQFAQRQDLHTALRQKVTAEEQHKIGQLEALKAAIAHRRKNLNLWQKLVFLFRKLEEEKSLPVQEQQLVQVQADNKLKLEAATAESLKVDTALNARRTERFQMESSFAQLVPLQDGNIIGNGRSDFTLQSHAYRFTANGQKYQLIDVPGIEGNEKQVMGAIEASVKKAHAVFYVTRSATPPGSGSDGQEGTIDKIKRQLGQQTEVWAIYNKSATNPQVLQGATLINQNDCAGLADMDKSLTHSLGGKTYKGHICLSAMPAFLASASCLVPTNPHVKSREKFLKSMDADEILRRSGMEAFVQFIRNEICQNFREKIPEANLKKIRTCMQAAIDHLHEARDNFANAAQKLEVQQKSAGLQIDTLLSGTSQKLKSECHDQLTEKKTAMRTAIYGYIDEDHTNDEFKEHLTAAIEELKTSVGTDLEKRFAKVFDMFKHEAGEVIKKNQKNVGEILRYTIDHPFSSLKLNFNTDFTMDNGINVMGLISTLGGAAALIWGSFLASNPLGWTTAAVLGAVGLVFSFYKAVRSFFSSDYKKEQQRKSADENLDKVFAKLTEMLDSNLDSASEKINEALLDTKRKMALPYEQSVNTQIALEGIAAQLAVLRDKIVAAQKPIAAAADPVAQDAAVQAA